jgi:hypothetical protein
MTFFEFNKKFPTKLAAIDYFVNIRYNNNISCPHCGSTAKIYRHRQRPSEIGGTYRTSWRMLQQIRAAMGNSDTCKLFTDMVEIDETYVGGKLREDNRDAIEKMIFPKYRGRGSKKTPVVGVIERKTKQVHAQVMPFNSERL